MKHLKRLAWVLAGLWAAFGFIASNTPADVAATIGSWTALPLLQSFLSGVAALALNPLFYVTSMFTLGTVAGWQLNEWKRKRQAGEWWESLGVKMSLLNYDIKDTSYYDLDAHALNGKIDVVRIEAQKRGLAFPLYKDGFTNADQLTPYLARVSVLLEAGNVRQAKQLASSMSKAPPS